MDFSSTDTLCPAGQDLSRAGGAVLLTLQPCLASPKPGGVSCCTPSAVRMVLGSSLLGASWSWPLLRSLNLQAEAAWRSLYVLGLGDSGEKEDAPISCPASESLARMWEAVLERIPSSASTLVQGQGQSASAANLNHGR